VRASLKPGISNVASGYLAVLRFFRNIGWSKIWPLRNKNYWQFILLGLIYLFDKISL